MSELLEEPIGKRGRGIYLLPNLFTLTALFAGFYSIVASAQHNYETAAIAIFIAMIFDTLDGRVARLTNTQTNFGAELDSLSDMVSFGVAPALLCYHWSLYSLGKLGWLAAFIYTATVALRLARFNTRQTMDKRYFQGLACDAGAGLVTALVWLAVQQDIEGETMAFIIALVNIAAGLLMASSIPYRSFKDLSLQNRISFVVMTIVALVIVLIALDPPVILFATFFLYALSGPVMRLLSTIKKRRSVHKPKDI
ncbi:MAG: CDP-diacylglycerol--serine O-phosphatidyltransferase [Pseudomonadota bacterium]|nr:CDP-diacylglycerol--serine O-phosphatidyltransferase [Pseudomonadota bacterium]